MNEQEWNWNETKPSFEEPENAAVPPVEKSAPEAFASPAFSASTGVEQTETALPKQEAAEAPQEEAAPAPAVNNQETAPAPKAPEDPAAAPAQEASAFQSAPAFGAANGEYHYGPAQQSGKEYAVYRQSYAGQSLGGYAAVNIPGTAGNPYGSTPDAGSYATPRPRTGYGAAPGGAPAAEQQAGAAAAPDSAADPLGTRIPGYGSGVPGSVGNPYGSTPGYTPYRTPQPGASAPQPPVRPVQKKKKARLWWIAPVIILAMLIGVAGGIGCYHLLRGGSVLPGNTRNTAPTQPAIPSSGDLAGRIIEKQNKEDYVSPGEIYQTYSPSVVGIVNDGTRTNIWGQETPIASSGTGFIISEDGYILTNYHVVEGAQNLTVTLFNRMEYPAELVGYENEICDVALLKIDATGLTPVVFGDSDAAMIGEEVSTIGNPLGELTFSMTVGHLSAKERAISDSSSKNPIGMMQTDSAINSGNSGGPLFDCTGAVIGIVTAKFSGQTTSGAYMEGLGFAIPINTVKNMLDDLQTLGYAAHRAYLGVRVGDSADIRDQELPHGAYISSVESGFCAEKAGLKAGDVIVGMDSKIIASFSELVTVMQGYTAGQTVELTVYRSGEYIKLTLTFDARPQNLD